jgi:ubiquinone/menaquinone biosynthesis C-methylase UbiE
MASSKPQPSPQLFFDATFAYQRTAALKAAIELGVFTAIAEGARTPAELAKKTQVAEKGARILADYLVIQGFLTKPDGRYALTPDSAMFLDQRSPAYLGGTLGFLTIPDLFAGCDRLTDSVRKGGTPDEGTVVPENPIWVEFARHMAPMMMPAAHAIAKLVAPKDGKPMRVLDVAAGHGAFGITMAQAHPQAEITALDWRNVLEVAQENAHKAGLGARYKTLPGSAFDVDFGAGYDVVLLTNFIHHFDEPTNEKLLKKTHAALAPDGRAVILEFVPNDDRVSPPMAAGFALTMLAGTPDGDAYTHKQIDGMCRNAGFRATQLHSLDPMPEAVIVAEK